MSLINYYENEEWTKSTFLLCLTSFFFIWSMNCLCDVKSGTHRDKPTQRFFFFLLSCFLSEYSPNKQLSLQWMGHQLGTQYPVFLITPMIEFQEQSICTDRRTDRQTDRQIDRETAVWCVVTVSGVRGRPVAMPAIWELENTAVCVSVCVGVSAWIHVCQCVGYVWFLKGIFHLLLNK